MSSSASSSATNIHALLKKTEHYDKDERYMATSDLCEVLKRTRGGGSSATATTTNTATATTGRSNTGISSTSSNSHHATSSSSSLDAATERRICTAVLRLLHDKSNDVQAIAVKTLGVLLTTVQEEQVLEIADSLADQVLDASKSELRDVYAIGLRTLVQTIPPRMGDPTSGRLVGRLLEGIRGQQEEEIVLCCLDILTDLLGRFGSTAVAMTRQHEPILQMCLAQIHSAETVVVRKRAGTTIGCLSVVLSDTLLVSMVERLLGQLLQQEQEEEASSSSNTNKNSNKNNTRALIRTMCTVSGAVGHRLQQPQIDRIIPIFLKYTNPEEALTGDDDDIDDEEGIDNGAGAGAEDTMNDEMAPMSDDLIQDEGAMAVANELRDRKSVV